MRNNLKAMPTASERNLAMLPETRLVSQSTAAKLIKKHRQRTSQIVAVGRQEGEMVESVLYLTRDSLVRPLTRQRCETADAARND